LNYWRNFMVPLPSFPSWAAFNAWLEEQCRKRQADILRGHTESADLSAIGPRTMTRRAAAAAGSGGNGGTAGRAL
jgi:hypothetical protein